MTKSVKKPVVKRDAVLRSFKKVLERTQLLSMATVNKDGGAHSNTAFFVHHKSSLFFLSDVRSTHCKNITRNSKSAVAVFDSRQKWNSDKLGIQLFGRSEICADKEESLARKLYAARYPAYASYLKQSGGIPDPNFRFFGFRIEHFVLLDEEAFGEENFLHFKL
jgi:uncharacterized protein YhbP (UPF0306 family)